MNKAHRRMQLEHEKQTDSHAYISTYICAYNNEWNDIYGLKEKQSTHDLLLIIERTITQVDWLSS